MPSLKAENHGNDPSIAIVPAGSSGWAGKDDKSTTEKANTPTTNGQSKLEQGNSNDQSQNLTNNFHLNNVSQQVTHNCFQKYFLIFYNSQFLSEVV